MIGYVVLGTNDLARAAAFHDGLFRQMGEKRLIETPRMIAWGSSWDQPMVALSVPEEGAASVGQGTMLALVQKGRKQVDALHAKALELGGTDDGAPAVRGMQADQAYYAGYVRDPDGHRLCFFYVGAKG